MSGGDLCYNCAPDSVSAGHSQQQQPGEHFTSEVMTALYDLTSLPSTLSLLASPMISRSKKKKKKEVNREHCKDFTGTRSKTNGNIFVCKTVMCEANANQQKNFKHILFEWFFF